MTSTDTRTAIPGYTVGTWTIDPVHSEVGFSVRHMMVSKVRGRFTSFSGEIVTGADPLDSSVTADIALDSIVTGQEQRDAHIRSADFFDVENHPKITFVGRFTDQTGGTTFKGEVELTIRGVTRKVPLDIVSLGEWKTPFWVGEENKGELHRIGFEARATINRHDFGVSWQDELPGGGVVVSNEIELVLDVEAILLEDLERTGAIEYYRD